MEDELLKFAKTIIRYMTSKHNIDAEELSDIVFDTATELRLIEWQANRLINLSIE